MEIDKARHIRNRWTVAATAPCHHHNLEKETELGEPTGNYVCPTCGESLTPEKVNELGLMKDSKNQS